MSWELSLGFNLKPSHRVCSLHFQDSDYIPSSGLGLQRKLKRIAVPSATPTPFESDNNSVIDEEELLRRKAQEDFEQLSEHMMVRPEEVPALREEARTLLRCISSEECRQYSRTYIAAHGNEYSSILMHGRLGPFQIFPDMTEELFNELHIYEDLVGGNFVLGKLITEVIAWAIAKLRNCTREEAESYLDERSKKVEILHTV